MVKTELDPMYLLSAYEIVTRLGEETKKGYCLAGIEAFSDYDGYNIYLAGDGVQLRLGFHNTYKLDYKYEYLRDEFLKKIKALVGRYKR